MNINNLFIILLIFLCVACKKDTKNTKIPKLGTCKPVIPHGTLSFNSTLGTYTYTTQGGGIIIVDSIHGNILIKHNGYPNFKYEFWYDMSVNIPSYVHENLNGKHIKDKIGSNRTVLFPDGSKITLAAQNNTSEVLTISIYDQENCYWFNVTCNNTLEYSGAEIGIAQALDNEQADGETSSFEITSTGLLFYNIYTEDTPDHKVNNKYNLGGLEVANPAKVNDYYNDPRLPHT